MTRAAALPLTTPATPVLRPEERIGLAVAALLHLGLVAVLVTRPAPRPAPTREERVVVNLSSEAGLTSTAPDPVAESRASQAPELAPDPAPAPAPPEPLAAALPPPAPAPAVQRAPTARPQPAARPVARPTPLPTSRPTARATPQPARSAAPPRKSTRTPPRTLPRPAATRAGAGNIGADFLDGVGSSTTSRETRVPASQIGAAVKSSLFAQISREIRPHWNPPSGADAEKLVTVLRWRLNPDGSLAGTPTVVRQTGVTESNAAQKERHAELAIRAVQLAAPFDLDPKYYEAFRTVGPIEFDWRLSQ